MTNEEAIEVLENGDWWEELAEWYMIVHPEHNKLHDAVDMAISALRQQETVTNRNGLNEPLTMDELRSRAGGWVWVVVNYEHCKCDGWALVPTPTFVAYLDQTIPIDFYGKKFVAYDHKPEED